MLRRLLEHCCMPLCSSKHVTAFNSSAVHTTCRQECVVSRTYFLLILHLMKIPANIYEFNYLFSFSLCKLSVSVPKDKHQKHNIKVKKVFDASQPAPFGLYFILLTKTSPYKFLHFCVLYLKSVVVVNIHV